MGQNQKVLGGNISIGKSRSWGRLTLLRLRKEGLLELA